MASGSCLCGAVRIYAAEPLGEGLACHCSQCRKQSGHYWASVEMPKAALTIEGAEAIRWYQASEKVRRGFCGTCGSFLFWEPLSTEWTGVSLGLFDAPTGARLTRHIFVADKGDYYDIADGLPQNPQ